MWEKVSDDQHTRRAQNICDYYNIELSCNEMTVLFFNFITDRTKNSKLVKLRWFSLYLVSIFLQFDSVDRILLISHSHI